MSEQQAAGQQEANLPVFRLLKLFVKDLSFENPNAPEIFQAQHQSQPKVEVNMGLKNRKLADDHYEVLLSVTAKVTMAEEDKTLFIAEVEHGGIFLLQNIPAEHIPMVLAVDCPAFLFPYTRQILSQISTDGGFIPFLLEPVNFLALYQNAQVRNRQGGEQQ